MDINNLNAQISHKDTKAASLYPASLKKLKYFVSILFILPLFFFITGKASANFTDAFTAPDGTDIHTYNPIYTVTGNPVSIQNNSVTPDGGAVFISGNNFADGCMSMDVTGTSSNTTMDVRNIGGENYGFTQSGGQWTLVKNTDTTHVIASGNLDFSGTHNYKLCAIGNSLSVYKDGVQFASGTDNEIVGSGGQSFYSQGNTMDNLSITVNNNAEPVLGSITITPNPIQVNTTTTASGSFIDPDTTDTHIASWNWGDGNTTTGTVTETNGSGSVSDSHTYTTAGVYTVTLKVTDNGGASGSSPTQSVTVYNHIPFTFTDAFTAPDGTDIHTYNPIYTVTGNPVSIQNNSVAPNGSRVFISGNNFSDGCMSMDWTGNSTNTNMSIRDNGTQNYDFAEFQGTGHWWLIRTDGDHIIASGDMSFSGTHNYKLCAIGSTISVYKDGTQFASGTDTGITGSGGQTFYSEGNTLDNLSITVGADMPPTVNSFSGGTFNEGGTYSSNGSFTDTDSTSWTGKVDYGDGSGEHDFASPNESIDQTNHTFSINHLYKDNQTNNTPYTVTVKIIDNQGATGTGTAQVTVNNVAPTPGAITVSNPVIQVNNSITASANFTDPGVLDTHNNSGTNWNWGDGNTTATVTENNGSGSVSDTHTYTATGVYKIILTVTDKDGGVGTSTYEYVSVYDSNTSFAGGRSFDNPSTASPSTSGKVTFGISAKYNNSNVLTGNAKMNFKAANLDFASNSPLTSLATTNGRAYLKGTGTLNGNSGYNFLATGIDGSVAGGNDMIRFQIKDSSNNVVYDSQPGAGDTDDPTTIDATGNIRVH